MFLPQSSSNTDPVPLFPARLLISQHRQKPACALSRRWTLVFDAKNGFHGDLDVRLRLLRSRRHAKDQCRNRSGCLSSPGMQTGKVEMMTSEMRALQGAWGEVPPHEQSQTWLLVCGGGPFVSAAAFEMLTEGLTWTINAGRKSQRQ